MYVVYYCNQVLLPIYTILNKVYIILKQLIIQYMNEDIHIYSRSQKNILGLLGKT